MSNTERKVPEGSACPACDGYGLVKSLNHEHAGVPCPHCDGTGDAFHPGAKVIGTPRTDAEIPVIIRRHSTDTEGALIDLADFARELERENADLREALEEITPGMPPVDAPCHAGIRSQQACGHCSRIAKARAALTKARGES